MPNQYDRSARSKNVTIVIWYGEDGTQYVEAYAAAGVRPASHKTAADRKAELVDSGVDVNSITVTTLVVK